MSYVAPNYTQIPNLLLEEHIKAMTEAEMRVALAIARKTFGWHKRQDKLSLSQLMNLTGMSRQGVINGVEAGIARGIIRRESDGQGYLYELVILEKEPVNEVDQCENSVTSQRSRPVLVNEVDQLKPQTSQRSRHTKERTIKETIKKADRASGRAIGQPPTPPPTPPKTKLLPNDGYDTAHVNGAPPPPNVAPPPRPKSARVDGRKFKGGRIPVGQGTNPVEVFYERYSINETKLSAPKEDDLIAAVDDLPRWREVVVAWEQSDYKPSNIKGQLDWYRDGVPDRKESNGTRRNGSNGIYPPATKPEDSDAGALGARRQREYNERYTRILADEINRIIPKDIAATLWEQLDTEFPDYQYRDVP